MYGCRITNIPMTPNPKMYWQLVNSKIPKLCFTDIHVRGEYPGGICYVNSKNKKIELTFEAGDKEIIKENTVDLFHLVII